MEMIIPLRELDKIKHYTLSTKEEVGGYGDITIIDSDTVKVDNVYIVKQRVTSVEVDYDKAYLASLYEKKVEEGKLMLFQWHSHNDMDTFFSGTDTGDMMLASLANFSLYMVTNHKGDRRLGYVINDFTTGIQVLSEDIRLSIEYPELLTKKDKRRLDDSFKELVTEPEPVKYTATKWSKGFSKGIVNTFGYQDKEALVCNLCGIAHNDMSNCYDDLAYQDLRECSICKEAIDIGSLDIDYQFNPTTNSYYCDLCLESKEILY